MSKLFRTTVDGLEYQCQLVDLHTQAHLFAQGYANGAYTLIHMKMDVVSLHKHDVHGLEPLLARAMSLLSCPLQLSYVVRSWSFTPYMDVNGVQNAGDHTADAVERGRTGNNEGYVLSVASPRAGLID